MCEFSEADGAALTLIAEGPTEAEEADGEGRDELDVVRSVAIEGRAQVGEIDGDEIDEGQEQSDLPGEERPAAEACGPGEFSRADAVLAEGKRRGGGEGETGKDDGEEKDVVDGVSVIDEGEADEVVWCAFRCGCGHTPVAAEAFRFGLRGFSDHESVVGGEESGVRFEQPGVDLTRESPRACWCDAGDDCVVLAEMHGLADEVWIGGELFLPECVAENDGWDVGCAWCGRDGEPEELEEIGAGARDVYFGLRVK